MNAGDDRREADEDEAEEEARERYRELLAELRTVIPGAQVLLAFLLTVPFAARFAAVDRVGKIVFTVSLMASAGAVVLFFAPAAYHRLSDREDRRRRLHYGIRLAVVAMTLTGIAVVCGVFVVVRFLFDSAALAVALSLVIALLIVLLWFGVPLLRRTASE